MKNSIRDTFATATTLLTIAALATLTLFVVGCGEGMEMAKDVIGPAAEENPQEPTVNGDMKQPEGSDKPTNEQEEPAPLTPPESTPLADTTPPTVVEVTWYSDWQMTEPLTDTSTVHPGDTIYTVVVFSEPVTHTVADDETARPALSIVTGDTTAQYKMLPRGVSFRSGEAKPLNGSTDEYLCKYTIPAETIGTLSLQIGNATTDLAGNTVTEISEHIAPFVVTMPEPTEPEEPIVEPTPPAQPADDPHLQRAIEIAKKMRDSAQEVINQALQTKEETGIYPWAWRGEQFDKILIEESGIDYFDYRYFVETHLLDIYKEENPHNSERIRKGDRSLRGIIVEYLRLYFTHPKKTRVELSTLFRQSCKDGKVSIEYGQFFQ